MMDDFNPKHTAKPMKENTTFVSTDSMALGSTQPLTEMSNG
jgi:hypothetical protein